MVYLTSRELIKLALAIKDMSPRGRLFKLLKSELCMRGYWKNKPRGNPALGYKHADILHSRYDS